MIRGNFMQFGNFKFFCFIFLFTIATFSQNLEDSIYDAIDSFVANPTKNTLSELQQKEVEFSKLVTSKDEKVALVILLCNKGSFEMKNNFQKNAITSYEKAWLLFSNTNLSNYDIVEYCLKPLGTLYTKTGNFTLAENIIKKYIFMAEKENNQATIISGYINLSIVYKTIGNYKTAIELLQKVEKNKKATLLQKNRIQEELTLNTIGLHKNNSAVAVIQNEIESNDFQSLKTKALLALTDNKPEVAMNYFAKAKQQLLKNKTVEARTLAKLYADEASIYIQLNDIKNAKKSFENGLKTLSPIENNWVDPKKTNLYPENTFLTLFDGLAYLENNTSEKIKWYNLSFYVSDLISDQLVSQEAEIRHQIENRKRTEKCLDLLWNAYQKNKDFKLLEIAFYYAEKTKNTVLKARNNQKTLLEQFPDNKDLQLQNQLLNKQESLINEYIRLQITQENETRFIALHIELAAVGIQLKNVNETINHQFKNKVNDFSLATLQQKLKIDQAQLVYYFWAKDKSYVFHINNQKTTWNKIDFKEQNTITLNKFIHYFDDANAINAAVLDFSATAYDLFQLLGFDQLEKNKNLIIIPDGLLHFVAFDALVTQKSTSKNYSTIPFLVYQNKIGYQTNATFYLKEVTPRKKDKIVGFFPVFKNTNAFLEYSIAESKALEKHKATLFMNEAANRDNFKQNVGQYAIIHLSTHGTSGSFSSPATLVFYDDVMLVNELYGLKNCNPDLVVLSACETGIGKLQKGEGAISIARAFQYAGAKNVLFSLWKINDYATSEIMTNFYDRYSSTHSFFESNYLSKINYLEDKSISNAKKSPYYWSAFVYYGAIDTVETNYFYFYVFGILLLIMLFLAYGRITRFLKRKKIQKNKI